MSIFRLSAWAIPMLWSAWALYWLLSALSVKATARSESTASRMVHVLPLGLAAWMLLSHRITWAPLIEPVFPPSDWRLPIGAALVALGLGFAVWARVHLGRNWSGSVTVKADHELVDSGPYGLTRHPIYTGLLLALAGSAIALDEWRGVLAVLVAWLSLWRKLTVEEGFMLEVFGERYADYRRRVPALLPFLGGSS